MSTGFAGIGIMGNAMVANLIRAGYEVHVWNRNAVKCEPLVAMGAKVPSSRPLYNPLLKHPMTVPERWAWKE
eukprot:871099-Pelagomonas_calceolata.AAC.6